MLNYLLIYLLFIVSIIGVLFIYILELLRNLMRQYSSESQKFLFRLVRIYYNIYLLYSFDENAEPVLLLAIKREKFLNICNKFPDSKRIIMAVAKKRRK